MDNFIRDLKGYQNTSDALKQPGIIVGYRGKPFNILSLRPEDVSKENFARCLAGENRYISNTNKPYSVGQHCAVGAEAFLIFGRPDLAKIFMCHDGSETILRDITKPVKNMLNEYEKLQDEIDEFIAMVHGLPWPYPPEIKKLDKNLAQYEMTFMMSTSLHNDYWSFEETQTRYLETWKKIEYITETYYTPTATF